MKCLQCVEKGERSSISIGANTTTLMGHTPYYDEDGVFHNHNPNRSTVVYSCSKGHSWTVSSKMKCPAIKCDWNKEEK